MRACVTIKQLTYLLMGKVVKRDQTAYAMKSIVVGLNVVNDLSIDELSGDLVKARAVPRSEQFLAVE